MKKLLLIGIILVVVFVVTGCTAGPNAFEDVPDTDGELAGFWRGLWHGIIAPITFVISLFNENIGVYAIHNTGGWYDFGFLFGFSAFWGGSGGGAARARRKRREG